MKFHHCRPLLEKCFMPPPGKIHCCPPLGKIFPTPLWTGCGYSSLYCLGVLPVSSFVSSQWRNPRFPVYSRRGRKRHVSVSKVTFDNSFEVIAGQGQHEVREAEHDRVESAAAKPVPGRSSEDADRKRSSCESLQWCACVVNYNFYIAASSHVCAMVIMSPEERTHRRSFVLLFSSCDCAFPLCCQPKTIGYLLRGKVISAAVACEWKPLSEGWSHTKLGRKTLK